ncbi:PIG-L family deacetylase, partial [Streptomyces sp. SID3343]|uniref:PIG-L family deacetylase n=1 Tax=Streptomyces sp. SID3343 TaxID=2690260 RepID=UPI00136A4670
MTLVVAIAFTYAVVRLTGPYGSPPRHDPFAAVPLSALAPQTSPTGGAVMQIVAHQDDDLYFMNPDLEQAIRGGADSVTVFLTAGEADGRNGFGGHPDPQSYAEARDNGSRGAYALMAVGDRAAPWDRRSVLLRDGAHAEVDFLRSAPHVKLVFLNTRKEKGIGAHGRLRTLWSGRERELDTLVPDTSPAGGPYAYTREGLIESLVDLLGTYRPTVVRTLDPDPDRQTHDKAHPRHSDAKDLSDHQDHIAAAQFAWEALRRHNAGAEQARPVAVPYRGYYNERWPHNLAPAALERKAEILHVYGWADRVPYCPGTAGCGDLKVAGNALRGNWPQSTTYRYPYGGPQFASGPDGRADVWLVSGGKVARWTDAAVGGDPQLSPGPTEGILAPGLSPVRTADGRTRVFALRLGGGGKGERPRRDVVTATETTPGGRLGPWTSLGNPSRGSERGLGTPVARADGTGRLHLFVRDRDKGVRTRVLPAGSDTWSGWTDLGGADVVEGLTATTRPDGRITLFATARDGIRQWDQIGERMGPARTIAADHPTGAPAAVSDGAGRIEVLYRRAGTPEIASLVEWAPGAWAPGVVRTAGNGYEPLSTRAAADGPTLVATRDAAGRPVVLRGDAPASLLADTPAAIGPTLGTDRAGRSV